MDAKNIIIPGKGAIFKGEVGATVPNYKTLSPLGNNPDWKSLGHTSKENMVSLSKDGGDVTSFDSWWEAAIDVQRAPLTWGVTVNTLEVTKENFDLAFNGSLETESETGGYRVPADIQATEIALFILAMQGTKRMGLYLPRVSISLGDAPSFDSEALFELPLSASILSMDGYVIEWFHPSLDKAATGS